MFFHCSDDRRIDQFSSSGELSAHRVGKCHQSRSSKSTGGSTLFSVDWTQNSVSANRSNNDKRTSIHSDWKRNFSSTMKDFDDDSIRGLDHLLRLHFHFISSIHSFIFSIHKRCPTTTICSAFAVRASLSTSTRSSLSMTHSIHWSSYSPSSTRSPTTNTNSNDLTCQRRKPSHDVRRWSVVHHWTRSWSNCLWTIGNIVECWENEDNPSILFFSNNRRKKSSSLRCPMSSSARQGEGSVSVHLSTSSSTPAVKCSSTLEEELILVFPHRHPISWEKELVWATIPSDTEISKGLTWDGRYEDELETNEIREKNGQRMKKSRLESLLPRPSTKMIDHFPHVFQRCLSHRLAKNVEEGDSLLLDLPFPFSSNHLSELEKINNAKLPASDSFPFTWTRWWSLETFSDWVWISSYWNNWRPVAEHEIETNAFGIRSGLRNRSSSRLFKDTPQRVQVESVEYFSFSLICSRRKISDWGYWASKARLKTKDRSRGKCNTHWLQRE